MFRSISPLFLFVVFAQCTQNTATIPPISSDCLVSNNHTKGNIDSLLSRVKLETDSLSCVSMKELRRSKSFQILFDSPSSYQEAIVQRLTRNDYPLTYKMWLIESQCQCDDIYLIFCKKVLNLYKNGAFNKDEEEQILLELLAPANSTSHPFLRRENNHFKDLLQEIKQLPIAQTELKAFIADVESGYVLEHWGAYY